MKEEEFFIQNLRKEVDSRKKNTINEQKKAGFEVTNDNPAKTGQAYIMNLQNALVTGKPNAVVKKLNDIVKVNENLGVDENKEVKQVKKTSHKTIPNRDDDDTAFDESVMKRMQAANSKIKEAASSPSSMNEEILTSSPTQYKSMINEEQLFELAQKAVNNAIASMYSKEKIIEVLNEQMSENRIKKIIYQTLTELKEMNDKKKANSSAR